MNILRVIDVPNNRTGGASRVVYGSGDAMERAGHRVEYLFGEDLGSVRPALLRRFVIPRRAARLIAEWHRGRGPFDVVEIHEPIGAAYARRWRAGCGLPPPVVISYGAERRSLAARHAYRRAKGLPVSLRSRFGPLTVVWQGDRAFREARHVICFNATDAAYVRALGRRADEVTQTRSGVSDVFLKWGEESRLTSEQAGGILFLGTWIERKGILDLIPAMTRVLTDHPTARLTLAGTLLGADRVLADFPESIRPRIDVRPLVRGDEALAELYRAHSVFALPSYMEGQPLVMLEAAAMGLAVVGSDTPGISDFIEHGRNGLLVPVGDDVALSAAVGRLVTDPAEAVRLGEAARIAVKRHTWEAVAVDMLAAYEAVVRGTET